MGQSSSSNSRTVIITGGNSGLGYACAHALLQPASGVAPWKVVLACRDPARAKQAVDRLNQEISRTHSSSSVEAMRLDLASLDSVQSFADEVGRRIKAEELSPLHGLVCNAGVQSTGGQETFTADGFETTFGVNHLGHFLLVNLLEPRFTVPARIAVVASGVHDPAQKTGMPAPAWKDDIAALAKGDLTPSGPPDSPVKAARRRYTTSKLANVLFTHELANRLPAGITVNAFDPGLMPGTGLARDASAPMRFIWHQVMPRMLPLLRRVLSPNIHTPEESGAALARLISDPALEGITGKYFEGPREIRSSIESYDSARATKLWAASMALTGYHAAHS